MFSFAAATRSGLLATKAREHDDEEEEEEEKADPDLDERNDRKGTAEAEFYEALNRPPRYSELEGFRPRACLSSSTSSSPAEPHICRAAVPAEEERQRIEREGERTANGRRRGTRYLCPLALIGPSRAAVGVLLPSSACSHFAPRASRGASCLASVKEADVGVLGSLYTTPILVHARAHTHKGRFQGCSFGRLSPCPGCLSSFFLFYVPADSFVAVRVVTLPAWMGCRGGEWGGSSWGAGRGKQRRRGFRSRRAAEWGAGRGREGWRTPRPEIFASLFLPPRPERVFRSALSLSLSLLPLVGRRLLHRRSSSPAPSPGIVSSLQPGETPTSC